MNNQCISTTTSLENLFSFSPVIEDGVNIVGTINDPSGSNTPNADNDGPD